MNKIIIAAVIFLSTSLTYASELSDQLEGKILTEDWKGFYQIINHLYNTSTEDVKIVKSAKAIERFLRNCDVMDDLPDNKIHSFRNTIVNGYKQIPKQLPFSLKVLNLISLKQNQAMARFSKVDQDDHDRKEEASSKREMERLKIAEEKRVETEQKKTILVELEEKRKQREEDTNKIEKLKQAEWEAKIKKEDEDRVNYQAAREKADNSPEYLKILTICNICRAMEQRKVVEKALAVDAKYAKKYGVVNLTRRDNSVQMIKASDRTIQEGKADYKDLFGRPFISSVCKKVTVDDCEGDLETLSEKLTKNFLAKRPK